MKNGEEYIYLRGLGKGKKKENTGVREEYEDG